MTFSLLLLNFISRINMLNLAPLMFVFQFTCFLIISASTKVISKSLVLPAVQEIMRNIYFVKNAGKIELIYFGERSEKLINELLRSHNISLSYQVAKSMAKSSMELPTEHLIATAVFFG